MSRGLTSAQLDGYGLLRSNDFAVYGKFMEPERQDEVVCWLDKGLEIRVIATGNSAAEDLDLRIYSPGGYMIASDTRNSADASVRFATEVAGQYRLNLELCRSSHDTAFCTVAVLQKNGYLIVPEDVRELIAKHALGNTLLAARTAAELRTLKFQHGVSAWPLLGCVLDSNAQAKRWANTDPGSFLVSVFADPNAKDVDAMVCDPSLKRIEDKGPEPYGVVEFGVARQGDCAFLVSVPRASKPTLSVMTVFRSE